MSRTFRRKNKEQPETYKVFTPHYVGDFWCGWSYIRLDGEDLKTALRKFHQEGNETYGCSAPKWHRKITTGVQRMHDKTELLRYIKYEGYEPIVFDKIPMEYWT